MSHTNSTANYQLPQFLGTDKPAWLTDVNQAYADIDTTMKANEVLAGQANALATQNASAISTQSGQISTLSTKVTALETAQPTDEAQIETNRQNIATNAQNIVEIDNRLGHTSIATIGDGTVTGAIDDLQGQIENIHPVADASDVDYDNQTSGLTATNVQDAIDEIAQGAGNDVTVRYVNGYIQLKDAQGWFNWKEVQRGLELFNNGDGASDWSVNQGSPTITTDLNLTAGAQTIAQNSAHDYSAYTGVEIDGVKYAFSSMNQSGTGANLSNCAIFIRTSGDSTPIIRVGYTSDLTQTYLSQNCMEVAINGNVPIHINKVSLYV